MKTNELVWYPERGYGHCPMAEDGLYDRAYWNEYVRRARTKMGRELTERRVGLVRSFIGGARLLDVGIGSGQFVEERPNTVGYDVNVIAIKWLRARKLWSDPYRTRPENMSCWDSLEHLEHPERLVCRVRSCVFVSLPVFVSAEQVLVSKHFKKNEHLWYWTEPGLVRWFADFGFECLQENRMEEELGRDQIGTFVFGRRR